MNSFELSRTFFNFTFENPEKIKPIHSAIYFFAIEHCNRLGDREKFGFPSQMTMEAIGVKNYQTYGKALKDLEDWGFIKFIERSKNQYSANIITIVATTKNDKARGKALDKATLKHDAKHDVKQTQSTVSINKPLNQETKEPNKPIDKRKKESGRFIAPSLQEIKDLAIEKKYLNFDSETFINFYESKGWMVGKSKMKDWKASAALWNSRNKNQNNGINQNSSTLGTHRIGSNFDEPM